MRFTILKIVFLFILIIPFFSYTGEYRNLTDYNSTGIKRKESFYIWDIDQFPIKVCIDSKLPKKFLFSIKDAISGWNQAWGHVLGLMLDSKRITFSQIDVDVPPFKILDEVYRPCSKEMLDQAYEADFEHIFITSSKLKKVQFGRHHNIWDEYSSGRKEFSTSIIEINENIDFSFKDTDVPRGKMRLSTVVRHELGHALGLPHNTNPNSLMYYNANSCIGKGRNECNLQIIDGIHFANLYGYFLNYSQSDLIYKSKCEWFSNESGEGVVCYD